MKTRSIAKIQTSFVQEGVQSLTKEEAIKLLTFKIQENSEMFDKCYKSKITLQEFMDYKSKSVPEMGLIAMWIKACEKVEGESLEDMLAYFD